MPERKLKHIEESESDVMLKDALTGDYQILLYNDDYNTFEHVIDCLMKYCGHDVVQAEQCAWIVHTKGKCPVKSGDYSSLEPVCSAMCDRGLSATVELL